MTTHLQCLLLALVVVTTHSQHINDSIQFFSDEIVSLFCDGLSVGGHKCNHQDYGIQDLVNSFSQHFDDNIQDISTTTQQIIDRLNTKLNIRASFLKNISTVIQQSCIQYGYNEDWTQFESTPPEFDQLKFAGNTDRDANLPNDIKFNSVYGNNVSLTSTTYKLPNNVDFSNQNVQKDAQISSLLNDIIIDLYNDHCIDSSDNEEYCSMYFGTINGVFTQFPGVENTKEADGNYSSYDARFRPWYVSASSGSKDVIILLDRSGSMGKRPHQNRIILAKKAVISVLKTLGSSSFVSVIAFNDDVLLSCFGEELVPATKRNVAKLVQFIEGLEAGGQTNFTIAFDAAFNILAKGAKSCQTSILFLTDGIADDVTDMIKARNTEDIKAVIFSYTLGDETIPDVPQNVADITNGIYTHIDDDDTNLITIMSSYYLYYAYGSAENDNNIIVTSPYLDFDTGIAMVTMAMSIYLDSTYFVGVVGVDIPLSFLSDAIGDIIIGRKSYSFVINQQSEVIIHPLLTTLFSEGDEYKAVYIKDIEPKELNTTLLTMRQNGYIKIEATVKQSAGNVVYNGYIHETGNLLYIYSGVGPSSLSIVIVIYTDSDIEAPMVKGFGLNGAPNIDCNVSINTTEEISNCLAPFNLYHDLENIKKCNISWINYGFDMEIINSSILNGYEYLNGNPVSFNYAAWYLQPGGWSSPLDAIKNDITCWEIEELIKLTNRKSFGVAKLPFDGFRQEISAKILNSIYTMTSMGEFWKSSYLASDSSFFFLYFATYQGLSIKFPAIEYETAFNALIRPWYQRAVSYRELFVFTTPYSDAVTGVLVISGATVITEPNSIYPYGVTAFDYRFNEFISYWNNTMNNICNTIKKTYCYLIDSSGFLLYYDGIKDDVNDSDISIKFFGDYEPTLMQSLIERGFFINDTNTNFKDDTIDISYITDNDIYYAENMDSIQTSFSRNYGLYTVHMISKTNLYVIYIEGYQLKDQYPINCPLNDDCSNVISAGCLKTNNDNQCKSATIDVCYEPDTISISSSCSILSNEIDNFGICILQNDQESNMCASNFNTKNCISKKKGTQLEWGLIIGAGVGAICLIVFATLCVVICYMKRSHHDHNNNNAEMARVI